MSEFSSGVLFLKSNLEDVKKNFKEQIEKGDYILYPLNEKWHGLYPLDMFLMKEQTTNDLKSLSNKVPLLYFLNCEDHDWGYKLFANGETRAYCMIPTLMSNPESCISAGGPYLNDKNLSELKIFNISENKINKLKNIITLENIDSMNDTQSIRDKFMEYLNIKEFEFMSYNYLIDEVIDEID